MRVFVVIVSMLALAACSGMNTRWEHAEIPTSEWRVDGAQCKYKARRKAEREHDAAALAESSLYDDSELSVDAMMTSAGVTKRTREFFAQCMQGLGYTPVG